MSLAKAQILCKTLRGFQPFLNSILSHSTVLPVIKSSILIGKAMCLGLLHKGIVYHFAAKKSKRTFHKEMLICFEIHLWVDQLFCKSGRLKGTYLIPPRDGDTLGKCGASIYTSDLNGS
jgi:hypothetical protein